MKNWKLWVEKSQYLIVFMALMLLAYGYLLPASRDLMLMDGTRFLGDGGDGSTAAFQHNVIIQTWLNAPQNLLYGTVYSDQLNLPDGFSMWIPTIERLIVVLLQGLLPLESLQTGLAWTLFVLNGLAFYWLGRTLKWRPLLSFALGAAFAFNGFTRARSISHIALIGLYGFPLILIALHKWAHSRKTSTFALSAFLLLCATTSAHYYLILMIIFSPFFLWYYFREASTQPYTSWKQIKAPLVSAALVALPASAFLAWNFVMPLAPEFRHTQSVQTPPTKNSYGFLKNYHAWPIDYLAGDLALESTDWNPLREKINASIRAETGNRIERSNGVRWSLLIFWAGLVVAFFVNRLRRRGDPSLDYHLNYFVPFALIGFWASLGPDWPEIHYFDLGLSYFINTVFPNFRIPSRVGPLFHFGLLLSVGSFLTHKMTHGPTFWNKISLAFSILVLVEYPPLQPVLTSKSLDDFSPLMAVAENKNCGAGLVMPYAGPGPTEAALYHAIHRLKNTNCKLLNLSSESEIGSKLIEKLGPDQASEALTNASKDLVLRARILSTLACTRARWIAFDPPIEEPWIASFCARIGWPRVGPRACTNRQAAEESVSLLTCEKEMNP